MSIFEFEIKNNDFNFKIKLVIIKNKIDFTFLHNKFWLFSVKFKWIQKRRWP